MIDPLDIGITETHPGWRYTLRIDVQGKQKDEAFRDRAMRSIQRKVYQEPLDEVRAARWRLREELGADHPAVERLDNAIGMMTKLTRWREDPVWQMKLAKETP